MKKHDFYKHISVLILFVILGFFAVGCSGEKADMEAGMDDQGESDKHAGHPQYGGILRIISTLEPVNLGYPPDIRQYQERLISKTALETLVRYDEESRLQPLLAERWETDPDNKLITFYLKKDIQFHDGSPFNAEAVKWNLDQWRVSGKPVLNEDDTESIDVLDEYTVQIKLKKWSASALEVAGTINMISPVAYEEKGLEWIKDNPVGTGPYVFESWEKGNVMKFKRNENYWMEGKPYLDGVEWYFIPDSMTAEASIMAEDFHVFVNTPVQVAKNLEQAGLDVVRLKTGMAASGVSLVPESANPNTPFANIKVREALNYAINRQEIVDSLYYGYHTATNQWAIPGTWLYNDEMTNWPYDPDKARQLIKEAGYPNGFETNLSYRTSPENDRLFTSIQGYLSQVGINVHLDPVDTGKFQQLSGPEGWDGLIGANFRVDADLPFHMNVFMGSKGYLYRDTYIPEELDAKLAEAQSARSFEEKIQFTQELQKLAFEDYMLHINLFVSSMTTAKVPHVKDDGFNQTYADSWTPEDVWLEK